MSTSNGFSAGERVVMLAQGTVVEDRLGTVIAPPMGRIDRNDAVWIQLDRPISGMTVVQPPIERVRRVPEPQAERPVRESLFAPVLREYRDRRRLSQSRLAEAAGFDHSYVSRLETGTRMPTREAVMKLAEAMVLDDADRDALLASAGFMPGRIENLLASEPVLGDVLGLLQNRAIPAEIRDDVRHMIALLVRQAQRAAVGA